MKNSCSIIVLITLLFICNSSLHGFSLFPPADGDSKKRILYCKTTEKNIDLNYFNEDKEYSGDNDKIKRNLNLIFSKISASYQFMSPRKYVNSEHVPIFRNIKKGDIVKPNSINDASFKDNGICQVGMYYLSSNSGTPLLGCRISNSNTQLIDSKFLGYTEFDIIIASNFFTETDQEFEDGDSEGDDEMIDVNSTFKHEFGHAAGFGHTNDLTKWEKEHNADGTAGGGTSVWGYPGWRLMYPEAVTDDDPSKNIFAVCNFFTNEEDGYKCIYTAINRESTNVTTTYDNCDWCIRHEEGYDGTGGGNSPINYSLTDFNGKLNWQIENPALANKISGYNIFVKTESGYTSINKAFIRSGSKAFYSVVPENYDNNSEYRLEVVYKNGLRDFVKFDK